jgi:hypothetical protein
VDSVGTDPPRGEAAHIPIIGGAGNASPEATAVTSPPPPQLRPQSPSAQMRTGGRNRQEGAGDPEGREGKARRRGERWRSLSGKAKKALERARGACCQAWEGRGRTVNAGILRGSCCVCCPSPVSPFRRNLPFVVLALSFAVPLALLALSSFSSSPPIPSSLSRLSPLLLLPVQNAAAAPHKGPSPDQPRPLAPLSPFGGRRRRKGSPRRLRAGGRHRASLRELRMRVRCVFLSL